MRDFAVKLALKLGIYKLLVNFITKFKNKKMNKAFKRYGLEALINADKVCRENNIKMFLAFGTLLGAYREKGFIPHDNDLDVGMMADQRPDSFEQIMSDAGFEHIRQFYVKETDRITEDQFNYKGVQIDFFYYFENESNDTVFTYCARRHETKEWKEANRTDGFPCVIWPAPKSEFVQNLLFEHQFYMPVKAKDWIAWVYGDGFMTPVKEWSEHDQKTAVIYPKERLYRR